MSKYAWLILFLLLFALPARGQAIYNDSVSTSYNNVTVTFYLDAGWSNDLDQDCGEEAGPNYPWGIGDVYYQVNGGSSVYPSGNQITITPINYGNPCGGNSGDSIYRVRFSYNDTYPGSRNVQITVDLEDDAGSWCYGCATDQLGYSVPGAIAQPLYYITSISYDPVGNESTNGFTNTQSNGTMSSISQTFTESSTTTFSEMAFGLGSEWQYGSATGSGNTQSVQETHSAGFGSSISGDADHVDHTNDSIYLFLNPQVTIVQSGPNSATYSLSTVNAEPEDVIALTVAEMQNPSLISSANLNPHYAGNPPVLVPGVSNICANPSACTAADFAPIIAQDLLAAPGANSTPSSNGVDRYVYITSDYLEYGYNNTFTQNDSIVQSQTFTQTTSYSVGYKGSEMTTYDDFSLGQSSQTIFTWTDSQSVGTNSGTANQAQVTLKTSSPSCDWGVNIYEDTVYHTFVIVGSGQEPSGCN